MIDSLRLHKIALFLVLLFCFALPFLGDRVSAGTCDYFIGGCGNRQLDDRIVSATSEANCLSKCGGRTYCETGTTPWGCTYAF